MKSPTDFFLISFYWFSIFMIIFVAKVYWFLWRIAFVKWVNDEKTYGTNFLTNIEKQLIELTRLKDRGKSKHSEFLNEITFWLAFFISNYDTSSWKNLVFFLWVSSLIHSIYSHQNKFRYCLYSFGKNSPVNVFVFIKNNNNDNDNEYTVFTEIESILIIANKIGHARPPVRLSSRFLGMNH